MFFGSYTHKLDNKGRLVIPSKFRKEIREDVLYVMHGFEGCLSVYPLESFKKEQEYLASLRFTNKVDRTYIRLMLSSVVEIPIDNAGRLPIPKATLTKYGINEEVIVVGVIDHFEVWDLATWNKYQEENITKLDEIAERLQGV